eukprot:jgi/Undpi1/5589/HiC_scaffold_2.g00865.m1
MYFVIALSAFVGGRLADLPIPERFVPGFRRGDGGSGPYNWVGETRRLTPLGSRARRVAGVARVGTTTPSLAAGSYILLLFLAALSPGGVSASRGKNSGRRNKPPTSTVRDFYITTELVEWDYAPTGNDLIDGVPLLDNEDAVSLYKEYTDDTYTTEIEAPEWAGNLGPIIRAEVGDTIMVHFKNMLPDLPASMHPHGVLYTPENEGTFWRLNNFPGSSVAPGDSFTYEWTARDASGPTGGDRSNLWFYHGHVDSVPDMYAGQIGPLIIYEEGVLDKNGMPTDVDEEFIILFMVSDENQSHYLETNIDIFGGDPDDEDFEESNLMHSMNGFLYGNLPGLEMREGDTVRWHVAAYGTEVDLHTAHWHGNNVLFEEKNVDTLELLPSTFLTAIMTPDAVGTWL